MPKPSRSTGPALPKSLSGISGLDEITRGGLPKGRPTLICGEAGCGKTLFALHFLIHGIRDFHEPGVFISFEERRADLEANVESLGFDLAGLQRRRKLVIDHVRVERAEIEETGAYDLEGLFVRIGCAIDSVGAKRIVLDTVEALFSTLSDSNVIRSELRRLFEFLKDRGVTAIITAERGKGTLTRHGIEEYVSDCVIVLDHRVINQVSTRRLRVIKYRGSAHGTNEYPFLIDHDGFTVLPITSAGLKHEVSSERISAGVDRLDAMLDGGYYRGSSILVSGTAGTGKTSLAAHFVERACSNGERCLYFAFEESAAQITRNMRSVGIDLKKWLRKGNLEIQASRPTAFGLETHLVSVHRALDEFRPTVVAFDPISNMIRVGSRDEVGEMLMRTVDMLKSRRITAFFTSLTSSTRIEQTDLGISSLMDTWILLRDIESQGERNRRLYILKSRGMAHSNQIREFVLTSQGIKLLDVYVGTGAVLTGSARIAQEATERMSALARQAEIERRKRALEVRRLKMEADVAELERQYELEESEVLTLLADEGTRADEERTDRDVLAVARKADRIPVRKTTPARRSRV